MQERGAGEPRHQRGVLDRIPEPEAAPAQDVIGPPAAERDAEREEAPGGESPRPHPARPGGIDAAFEQGGDGEGIGHREADIAEIEQRRMEGEAGILQQRIEAVAVERRGRDALEGIRGEQQEGEEADADQRLDREHAAAQGVGQVGAEDRDRGAEQRQDQRPQQHRALVVAPHARDFVDQRLGRMRVGDDVGDGEVGRHVGLGQRAEGQDHQERLGERRGAAERHQPRIAARRADAAGVCPAPARRRAPGSARSGRARGSCGARSERSERGSPAGGRRCSEAKRREPARFRKDKIGATPPARLHAAGSRAFATLRRCRPPTQMTRRVICVPATARPP